MYYAISDIALFVSKNEAFPLSVLEAMFCKLPVVSSNIEGVMEVIDSQVGFTHSLNNSNEFRASIIALSNNSQMRKQMGENAHKMIIDRFSVKKMSKKYRKLFNFSS